MTQSRSFLLPSTPPESGRPPRSDLWWLRLELRTAGFAIAGLLAVWFAAQPINDDQNAPYWPLFAAFAGQSIGLIGIWLAEGWRLMRDDRCGVGAVVALLGPVVAAVAGGLSWIVTIWASFIMS